MKNFLVVMSVMMLLVASMALAADPQSSENTQADAAGKNEPVEVQGVPDISVNEAEIQQYGSAVKSVDTGTDALPDTNPLMPEIERIQDEASAQLVALNDRLASQTSDQQALELIRQIETVKQQAELDIMRLQATAAVTRGDQDVADEINAAIEEMTSPRPVRQPIERPAPADARR